MLSPLCLSSERADRILQARGGGRGEKGGGRGGKGGKEGRKGEKGTIGEKGPNECLFSSFVPP